MTSSLSSSKSTSSSHKTNTKTLGLVHAQLPDQSQVFLVCGSRVGAPVRPVRSCVVSRSRAAGTRCPPPWPCRCSSPWPACSSETRAQPSGRSPSPGAHTQVTLIGTFNERGVSVCVCLCMCASGGWGVGDGGVGGVGGASSHTSICSGKQNA